MTTPEGQQAIDLAKRVIGHADPDGELVFLARSLLRAVELIDLGRENNIAVARSFEAEIDRLKGSNDNMLAALKAARIYVETLEKHLDPTRDPGAPTIRKHADMLRAAIAEAEGRAP